MANAIKYILSIFLLTMGLFAHAQLTSTMELDASKKSKESRFQAILMASSESNFQNDASPDARATSSFVLVPSYKISEFNTLGATLAFIQDHDDEQKSQMNNAKLYIKRKPTVLSQKYSAVFMQYFSGYLPTNEDSRKVGSFQGAIEYDPRLIFSLRPGGFELPLTYRLRLTKNFHEYSLSEQASPNISHSVANSLSMEKPLYNSSFSLGLDFTVTNAWTYRNKTRTNYSGSQYLGYSINPKTILQLGHSNTNAFYKMDGRTNNVEIYGQYSSMYFATMIMIF